MRAARLIELLKILPDNMEVFVQTCEGDLMAPLEPSHLWLTESWIDERSKTLEPAKLVITSYVKGRDRYSVKNDRSGVLVKYESPHESAATQE